MSAPVPLSPAAPLVSLRAAVAPTAAELAAREAAHVVAPPAGITQAEAARRYERSPQALGKSERRGAGVSVALLIEAAEACGGVLELRFVPGES